MFRKPLARLALPRRLLDGTQVAEIGLLVAMAMRDITALLHANVRDCIHSPLNANCRTPQSVE
jgi:hypothetical protein